MDLSVGDRTFDFSRKSLIMGILNVTPDSFWDGASYSDVHKAVARAEEMAGEGADIIDVGGESTRPGSAPVDTQQEIDRIGPVVERLLRTIDIAISVDTRKSAVAREMLALGVHMINDVSGLSFDQSMVDVVREYNVPVVIMHMRGTPADMQSRTDYDDVVLDVREELAARVRSAEQKGISPKKIIVDPGIGFSKTGPQCVELIARLDEFLNLGKPILVGPSRKSFMGKTIGLDPDDRLEATIACCVVAVSKGASIVRVHDVGSVARALRMAARIRGQERSHSSRVIG